MKNFLSWSALDEYKNCPRSFFYNRISKLRDPIIGSALTFGTALDKAFTILLDLKLDIADRKNAAIKVFLEVMDSADTNTQKYTNTDFDLDVLTQVTKEYIEQQIASKDLEKEHEHYLKLKKENKLKGLDLEYFNLMSDKSLICKGLMFIDAYIDQVLPKIKRVISTQHKIELVNDIGDQFVGYSDAIVEWEDGKIVLLDHKTAGQAYKDDSVRTSGQLATYMGVVDQVKDSDGNQVSVTHAGFIVFVKKIRKKKEPRVQVQFIIDKVPQKLIESVYKDYDEVNHLIHLGEFPRKPETCGGGFGCKYPEMCFGKGDKSKYIDKSGDKK